MMDYDSGVSVPALAIGLCSIEGEGGDGGGGGGGGGGDAGGAAAALAAAGGGDDAAAAAAAAAAAGGEDPEWLKQFSGEGGDADNPSNRDWLKAKGFKTVDDVAKSYREAEHAIRNGGKLTVPGEDAKPEEIAAFHKAIGVPEKADGYTFDMPDGVTEELLDMPMLGSIGELALAAGVPAAGYKALVEGVIAKQLDVLEASKTAENSSRDELFKEWGAQKDAKLADVTNGMRALGLKPTHVAAMQRGFAQQFGEAGSRFTLELLQKIGAGVAEDALLGGDGPRRFGITGPEAQAEIDKLIVDREFGDKLAKKDPDAVARWDRLNGAVAAHRDQEARKLAAT
jgi:hypothetical protein